MTKGFAKTIKWIKAKQNQSDMERVHSVSHAKKINRLIHAWEYIRSCAEWTPKSSLEVRLVFTSQNANTARRAARRILYSLHAAGFVDLSPWPPELGKRVHFRAKPAQWALLRTIRQKPRKR